MAHKVRGWRTHMISRLPKIYREGSSGENAEPRSGDITTELVDLEEVVGGGVDVWELINLRGHLRRYFLMATKNVIAPQGNVPDGGIVGGGAKHFEVFAKCQTPVVVIELAHWLDVGSVLIHPVGAVLDRLDLLRFLSSGVT